MSSKTTNKGVAWLYNEVCALLDIWADQEIQQQLAGRLHNMCIYEKISKRLADLGIHRTGEQCREKIKKLRRDYKTVVDNNYSPAFARKMLGCYDKVHEIFGKCTVIKPSFVIESIVYNENFSQSKRGIETDESGSQTIKDCPVSESQKPKCTISQQRVKTDSSDTSQRDTAGEKKVKPDSSSQAIQIDTTCEKEVKTDSLNTIHIDTIGEQKVKTDFSSASNPTIKKDPTNFRNAFETMKIKYSDQKTDWNSFKRRIERRLEKQKFLHNKILKRQAVLHNRFIGLERKKFIDEMEQEHQRLSMLETEREKHNEQEINLFKSMLQMMAEKQGVKLSFQCENVG
ncbi:hypothetical protein AVEN_124888-1 [Araneus ventricosus]|uniref:Myb/SANT-like DNA-binding domain-containing protein n=1 Tax=Araneus ventricosus TaxID=182803 RepID=A0A4Y2FYC3_ARAVE|nr:hypothetical protein AVEN_124888-1 [Araneus ventricosus]